ncbi:MAG TPA: TonB-dependent receptor, partial [Fimbriiglobus sp.]|nr:TonB-dependent receptor [Fimbriiglobus sp.]
EGAAPTLPPGAAPTLPEGAAPTLPQGAPTAEAGGGSAAAAALSGAPPSPTTATSGASEAPRAEVAPASAVTTSITGAGGVAGAALGAPDVGELLSKSPTSVGVEVQRRNAIVGDPRIRGYRTGQYLTYGDGGLFVPARLDLDTAAAKFDPGTVRDIVVVKGPYSALYGPGLSFLDVATLDSPRYQGYEVHGRSAGGYQTNGRRWDALQSVSVGDRDWGFRGTYNILQGNDYKAGDGTRVPSSYLSNNVNFAIGWDPTDKSRFEFKGLRVVQNNLEFPGLYFDIRQSDTEAYSARYTLFDQGAFDKFTLDAWYNYTAASGDTLGGAKQAFVQRLLGVSYNPQFVEASVRARGGVPITPETPFTAPFVGSSLNLFRDFSDTRFAARTVGYRAALSWGPKDDPLLTVGNDFRTVGQGLIENIRIQQLQGTNLNTGDPVAAGNPANGFFQTQRVPESNQINPGLFVQSALPLTPRWKLRSGGRLDYVHSSSNPRLIEGTFDLFGPPPASGFPREARFNVDPQQYSFRPGQTDLSRGYTLLAGFLQNEYKLDEYWTARLAVGHSQRAPTLTELYAAGPFIGVLQQGTSRLIGDPNLLPEKLTQFDLGLSADYQFFQFGATAFYAWVNDYITYDVNRSGLGLTQVVYTNTDLATLAGAEVFSQADLTAWLTGFGTLSYVQGLDQTALDRRRAPNLDSSRRDDLLNARRRKTRTEPLPQIPPLEGRVGLRFHAPSVTPRWQVEVSARMVTGQNNVATSLNEFTTPGFTVFNIRGFWRLTDSLLVSAGVENVGDKTYREHLDPVSGNLLGVGPLLRPGTNFFFNTQITY